MKIRTELEIQDLISNDFGWRKKELSAIKSNISTSRNFAKNTALRSGVALVYAHWEGFVKNVATYYLCYVAQKKLKYSEMKLNFFAIMMKQKLDRCMESNKSTLHLETLDFVLNASNESSQLPFDVIKTNSNLNSTIFKEIMTTIGLNYSSYELSFNLLDEQLLKMRNAIAHGESLDLIDLDEKKFNSIYEKVSEMMTTFESQIMNAVVLKEYLR